MGMHPIRFLITSIARFLHLAAFGGPEQVPGIFTAPIFHEPAHAFISGILLFSDAVLIAWRASFPHRSARYTSLLNSLMFKPRCLYICCQMAESFGQLFSYWLRAMSSILTTLGALAPLRLPGWVPCRGDCAGPPPCLGDGVGAGASAWSVSATSGERRVTCLLGVGLALYTVTVLRALCTGAPITAAKGSAALDTLMTA
mmetsp:Transcript_45907/g.90446  ORF Transcript_45907/g.90446 Transcript_45907/m.90446 type:complete len:200 (+) Transcript_45907:663-1262(+)